jgi:hypothetical protein
VIEYFFGHGDIYLRANQSDESCGRRRVRHLIRKLPASPSFQLSSRIANKKHRPIVRRAEASEGRPFCAVSRILRC